MVWAILYDFKRTWVIWAGPEAATRACMHWVNNTSTAIVIFAVDYEDQHHYYPLKHRDLSRSVNTSSKIADQQQRNMMQLCESELVTKEAQHPQWCSAPSSWWICITTIRMELQGTTFAKIFSSFSSSAESKSRWFMRSLMSVTRNSSLLWLYLSDSCHTTQMRFLKG